MKLLGVLALVLILCVFLAATITHKFYSSEEGIKPELEWHPILVAFGDLFILFNALGVAYLVQAVLQNFRIPTSYGGFIVILGYLWGISCYHDDVTMYVSYVMKISPRELSYVYIPVMIFQMAFSMDVPLFLKTFSQTLVIAFCVNLGSALLFGILASYIIGMSMEESTGTLLGIFTAPIYPQNVINILKQQSTTTKQISVLLEGESLFAFLFADYTHRMLFSHLMGHMVEWYHFVTVTIRVVLTAVATGLLFGYIGSYLFSKTYTNRLSLYLICLGTPFLAYSFSQIYASGCGSISVMIVGAMLGMERTSLPREIDMFLIDFWHMVAYVMDVVLLLKGSMLCASLVSPLTDWFHYPLTFVVYLANYTVRFLCFLLFLPIIRKTGYGMNLKYMVVCTWGGLKSSFGILTTLVFAEYNLKKRKRKLFLFYIVWIYFFSHFINGSFVKLILEYLGLTKISMARQVNMNNCMKHIFEKRNRTIAVLKMDRLLADANWSVVVESTEMTHPYQLGLTDEDNEDLFGYRFTWCDDCKKDILQEPTPKEMKEMIKEAKMRILKARRMSYSRQFQNGMMTKEGIRILSRTAELAMDSEDAEMKTENLYKNFLHANCFERFIRKQSEKLGKSKYKKPRTYWRRLCYKIVLKNRLFEKVMLVVVILNLVLIVVDIYYHPSLLTFITQQTYVKEVDYGLIPGKIIFIIIFLAEFVMKVLAYAWKYICYHGFRTYFKSFWNIIDFLALVGSVASLMYNIKDQVSESLVTRESFDQDVTRQVCDALRLLRLVRLLRTFEIFYMDVINYLNRREDAALALSFEVGKCFLVGENEILNMLPYMIDNTKIRNEMKQKIEKDKKVLLQLLSVVQKERPWIAITVKTTQAIRMILNGMAESINQLRATGWVDTFEHQKLMESLNECYKKVNEIKNVQPSSPKTLFRGVSWMADDERLIEFLFENVAIRMFQPGEVVFGEGEIADGIYILVTGLLAMSYKPDRKLIKNLKEQGFLPVVDYLAISQYEEETNDYIIAGNCLGELSTLTEHPYNCTITADAHSQVYVLSRGVLNRAMAMLPDPVMGLAAKIWKEISLRITIPILLSVPAYQTLSQDHIKYALERAFVPDLKRYKIFSVTEIIEDIILIRGVVVDYNTRETFVAPCYIPRTVQKLILPASSIMNVAHHDSSQTKMLIIPSKDVDAYDVMLLAEETCELMDTSSATQCLQHTVQDRTFQYYRKKQLTRRELARRRGPAGNDLTSVASSLTDGTASFISSKQSGSLMFSTTRSETGSRFFPADEEQSTSSNLPQEEVHVAVQGTPRTSDTQPPPPPPPQGRRRQSLFFM